MSGKKRRKDDLSDSDSDLPLTTPPDHPMDSDSPVLGSRSSPTPAPGSDPRPPVTSDPGSDPRSSLTTAPGTESRPSSGHARNSDPRSTPTTPGSAAVNAEPFLQSNGSYLVITPKDDNVSFRRINVFWPSKYFRMICGAENLQIETPANGSLIVRTQTRAQTKTLLKCTSFCEKAVTVSLHPSRNSTKGTIFAPEMRFMSEEEIMEGLRCEGVSHVRRLTTFRDGQRKDTSLLVLTFETTKLPDTLLAGHIRYQVRVFIPNPLRCLTCQRFGHSSKFCKQSPRCHKCGATPHEGTACTDPNKCLSCNSTDHNTNSSQCPVWKTEKEICAVKATTGVSYPQARRTVQERKPSPSAKTYAQTAKLQTATIQTQTDPIPQLPPLQLLKPVRTESDASAQTSTESQTPAPPPPRDSPRPQPAIPAPRPTARTGEWQTVQQKKNNRPANTERSESAEPHPHYSTRGRSEQRSHPPVRVSMGRNRTPSVGSHPRDGGTSKKV